MVVIILFLIILVVFIILLNNLFRSYNDGRTIKFKEVLNDYKTNVFDNSPSHVLVKGTIDTKELTREKNLLTTENNRLLKESDDLDYKNYYPSKLKKARRQNKENHDLYERIREREKFMDTLLKTSTPDRSILDNAYRDISDLLYLID